MSRQLTNYPRRPSIQRRRATLSVLQRLLIAVALGANLLHFGCVDPVGTDDPVVEKVGNSITFWNDLRLDGRMINDLVIEIDGVVKISDIDFGEEKTIGGVSARTHRAVVSNDEVAGSITVSFAGNGATLRLRLTASGVREY